jgi:hypothetical protein
MHTPHPLSSGLDAGNDIVLGVDHCCHDENYTAVF